MSKLPDKFFATRDQVINHVHTTSPLPENLGELLAWYENEGWDELVPAYAEEEHIVINLNYVSWLKFSDSELIASQEDEELVTDELRIKYARELIAETLEAYDGYDCPSVQTIEIRNQAGDSAVLGWLIEIHGQGGPVAIYQGAFTDKKQFYENLRECNFLLDTEQHSLTDESILNLWSKPPKSIRSIEVDVSWGNEQYKCPMAQKTWQRIVKGNQVRRVEPYLYEGKKYKSEWLFNSRSFGSLVVTYDDGGVGFDGQLADALIWIEDEQTSWIQVLMKSGSTDNLLGVFIDRSTNQDQSPPPFDYWVIDDSYVCEPSIGGHFLGEIDSIDLSNKRLLHISQEECDALMEAFFREEGAYPDS